MTSFLEKIYVMLGNIYVVNLKYITLHSYWKFIFDCFQWTQVQYLCSMTWKNTYVIYTDDHCLYTVCIHISEIRENGSKLLWVQYGTLSKIKCIGVQSNTLCFYTFYLLLCKTSLTLPLFIGVPVPRHEYERLCICVCIFPLSTISRLNFGTVATV